MVNKGVVEGGFLHRPVLYQEVLNALQPRRGGRYIDGTLGAGGHAYGVLLQSSPDGMLLGLDVDPQAIEAASKHLHTFGDRVHIFQASYADLGIYLRKIGWSNVQGILLDLGASSMQFDTPGRGFSFQVDAPLDMRFSPLTQATASDLVNTLTEVELSKILFEYGEERRARQIAKAIIQARPVTTTGQLSDLVQKTMNSQKGSSRRSDQFGKKKVHPATRTFQALRIAVNQELTTIADVLPEALDALTPGGRLAVISFHSLEDRIVKQFFRQESRDCICPPKQPICSCDHRARLVELTRRPVVADQEEILANPRSRSARLRVAEKL